VGTNLQQRPELGSRSGDLQINGFLGRHWEFKVQR